MVFLIKFDLLSVALEEKSKRRKIEFQYGVFNPYATQI